ncbi:hypothetical protein [Sphingobium yanoikuyae]|nr:hypothetical protein [Sphingobium yanoikuyae]
MSTGKRALILEADMSTSSQRAISPIGGAAMGEGGVADLLQGLEYAVDGDGADMELRPRAASFPAFLDRVDSCLAPQSEAHLLLDNYAISHDRAVRGWLLMHPKWKVHFSPDAASWLVQAQLLLANIGFAGGGDEGGGMSKSVKGFISQRENRPRSFSWVRQSG